MNYDEDAYYFWDEKTEETCDEFEDDLSWTEEQANFYNKEKVEEVEIDENKYDEEYRIWAEKSIVEREGLSQ